MSIKINKFNSMALIVFFLFLFFVSCNKKEIAESDKNLEKTDSAAILVEAVLPTIQKVVHQIRAVGSFLSNDEVAIAPEIEGKIEKIMVDEGDIIHIGQLLLQIEDKRKKLSVNEAEARIRTNKASLAYLKITLKRREALWKKQVLSDQDYEETLSQVIMTKARVDSLQAALNWACKNLEDTKVYSPMDGIIIEKTVSKGEYVHVGNTLLKVVKINPLKLHFTLPETYINMVRLGQQVKALVKSYPDENFLGKICFINPQIDPVTRAVNIKAYFDNIDNRLNPGFFADVFLLKNVNEKALVIPGEGVIHKEGKYIAYIMKNGVAKKRDIKIGEYQKGGIEIVSGINPDDQVITSGNRSIENGSMVKLSRP